MTTTTIPAGLQTARDYVEKLEADGFGWDLMVGDAFVRGMRDIGYKSTSYALAELIDNAMQASATQVDVVFGFSSGTKPTSIAIIDNGYGMDPNMARASLVWGAGTRASDRSGFGKYGYGLPSASVSQCRRVTVYSKPADGEWHSAYLDIDEISEGKWSNGNRIEMPGPKPQSPPSFVIDFLKAQKRWEGFANGTVVVWEKLDRIDRKQRDALRAELVTDLGVLYRGFLVECPLTVDGIAVEPCDPLFLTEGFRYYDLDADRAIELPGANVEVTDKDSKVVIGTMRVRYSRLPATFFRKPETKHTNRPGRGKNNERLEIADANNGIIFCRNGRQIDVLRPPRSLGNVNATTDRYWAVEVDFDASLDEMFSITTAKQQVRPDERVWDMLRPGLCAIFVPLRRTAVTQSCESQRSHSRRCWRERTCMGRGTILQHDASDISRRRHHQQRATLACSVTPMGSRRARDVLIPRHVPCKAGVGLFGAAESKLTLLRTYLGVFAVAVGGQAAGDRLDRLQRQPVPSAGDRFLELSVDPRACDLPLCR